MPILKEETREVILPEIQAKLIIKSVVTYGDFLEVQKREDIKNEEDTMLELASKLIKDWDITNEKGEKLEINGKTIKRLSNSDVNFLMKEITQMMTQKKNLK